jgi:hypothetical protein
MHVHNAQPSRIKSDICSRHLSMVALVFRVLFVHKASKPAVSLDTLVQCSPVC